MRVKWWHILVFVLIVVLVAFILHPSKLRTSRMFLNSDLDDKALLQLRELYQKDPNDYRVIGLIARALEDKGMSDEADKYYSKLTKLRPIDANFKEAVRFYTWNLRPEKAMGSYKNWYDQRLNERVSFKDEDGGDILSDLYGYALLYQDYGLAIDILKTQLATTPKQQKDIVNDIITIYGKRGDIKEMTDYLEKTINADPDNQYALETMMELALLNGKRIFVEKVLAEKIERDPNNAKLWQQMIDFETGFKDQRSANLWYKKWMEQDPSWKLKKQYVEWMVANEMQREAIKYLEIVLRSDPGDPYFNKTLFQLYEWNNDREKLLPIYLARFHSDPGDRANTKKLLALLFDMKRYGEAEDILTTLLARYPSSKEYNMMLVDIYDTERNTDAALAQLKKVASLSEDQEILKNIGERYMWMAGYNEALGIFQSLEAMTPNDPEVFRYMGDIHSSRNAQKKAISYYRKYADMQKDDYYPHYKIGEIYWSQANKGPAKEELKTALDMIEATVLDPPTRTAEARIYGLLGEKKRSDDLFERLLNKDPGNIDVANIYIETLIDMNDLKKAQKYADIYERDFPENASIQRNLVRLYSTKKDYKKAKFIISSLMEKEQDNDLLKTDYAYLLADMGENFEAFDRFEELSNKYPDDKDLQMTYLTLYDKCRPAIIPGFTFMKSGNDTVYGPYARFNYPVNDHWSFNADYALLDNSTNVLGYDPDFNEITNTLELMARYSPTHGMLLGAGLLNQLSGITYVPAGHLFAEYTNDTAGKFNIDLIYNQLFDDPVAGLYFDGREDIASITYENVLFNRFILTADYSSDWYRVNGAKN
ncbi:MAG: hypothetical protein COV46_01225 [Deltaproteobacteria bacterium CG11_big_fil_rev_8_21_14_0_20_49_13]|nr:MAG: hypothetical protein COV46_01225 [Deltaproteobacteria bacterium CG11_big_fil_rev_8_21_14_0_20_49_13]